ncbi:efflux transporter outer membrane subunit [Pseudomonas typographi]|uniref:Efflux transporter outer membrane subunit n=1 Tax=Pseudomonas typographi TaxID=2715964 RepID=A0ABR7Z172_9PSED|nr:efflux transporter outer membrane subunit [Pseudomonas typographi]MBD1551738.1 efflux transporter outer membrane subunit [Pseudomonas typographi]MBD1599246.1 efflux transporter outer membrane subunit [Pseudomonas typographi]
MLSLRCSTFTPTLLALAVLSGCSVGPDYQRPDAAVPQVFKEAAGWKPASPDDDATRGPWWQVYQDPTLAALLAQVSLNNQNVASYAAQYRQALALVRGSQADRLPTLAATVDSTRSQTGSGTASTYSNGTGGGSQGAVNNSHSATLSLSWEADLWGKLRRTLEENRASADASAAELASATLSAQAQLAQDYFQLRLLDQQMALYRETVRTYQRYVDVTRDKYEAELSTRADLAQAQTQLEGAQASLLEAQWQRAQYEHALALLVGKAPADFSLAEDAQWQYRVPAIPVGLPSRLLERRPDIAAAERQVAAANAAVGVATAAYYPDLTLSASGGYQGSVFSHLVNVPNRFWSIGPSLTGTLLDFGATRASVEQAQAAYDAQVATYRQTVLTGLGEVEDYLVQLRTQAPEIDVRQRQVAAAEESARVTLDQYEAGKIDYLDVATTQATLLNARQSLLTLVSTQMVTSVELIAALGGGWGE